VIFDPLKHLAASIARVRVCRYTRALCLVVLTVLLLGTAGYAAPRELTIDEALAQFYENNLDIIINRYEVDKSYADYVTAKLIPNPNLTVNYNNVEISQGKTNRGDNTQLTVRVDQLIETAGKRTYRTNTANDLYEAAKITHKDVIRNLLIGFYSLYYAINLDMFNVDFAKQELALYNRLLEIARKKHNAGFLSAIDYTKLKMRRIELANNVVNFEAQLKNDVNAFTVLLGKDEAISPARIKLHENLRKYNEEELVNIAQENRYDLLSLKRQLKAADNAVMLAKAGRVPDFSVGGEYDSIGNPAKNAVGAGFSIPLPIFSRSQGAILKSEAIKKQVETLITKTKRTITLEVQQSLNTYNASAMIFETYNQNKPEMDSLMTNSTKAFGLGGITVLDLLDAERTYRDFMTKYNQAFTQAILNSDLIKVYTGELK
jgi:outer membrane protein, heavy metal efflux system